MTEITLIDIMYEWLNSVYPLHCFRKDQSLQPDCIIYEDQFLIFIHPNSVRVAYTDTHFYPINPKFFKELKKQVDRQMATIDLLRNSAELK